MSETEQVHRASENTRALSMRSLIILLGCAVALLIVLSAYMSIASNGTFMSREVKFTDSSRGGLAIVPASCPSNPGDADAPNGCGGPATIYPLCPDGTLAPDGNVDACGGDYINGSSPLCPTGYVMQGGECTTATGNNGVCPNGYVLQNDTCVSSTTSCPVGYSQENQTCVFTGCPGGYSYSQEAGACVAQQCAPAYICGADGNQYLETSNCQATLQQQCSWGCSEGACLGAPTPTSSIIVDPSILKSGDTTNVMWVASDVQSCSVSGSNGDGKGWSCKGAACSATSTEISSSITAQTVYTLSCTGLDGSPFTQNATVNVVPEFQEE